MILNILPFLTIFCVALSDIYALSRISSTPDKAVNVFMACTRSLLTCCDALIWLTDPRGTSEAWWQESTWSESMVSVVLTALLYQSWRKAKARRRLVLEALHPAITSSFHHLRQTCSTCLCLFWDWFVLLVSSDRVNMEEWNRVGKEERWVNRLPGAGQRLNFLTGTIVPTSAFTFDFSVQFAANL